MGPYREILFQAQEAQKTQIDPNKINVGAANLPLCGQ